MITKHRTFLLFCILLPVFFIACSSNDTKPESGEIEASLTKGDDELPNADEVGSIPEDNPEALDELAKKNEAGSDPFADLEDNIKDKDANYQEEPQFEAQNAAAAGAGEMRTYTVRRGDTLMKIAFNLYGDIDRWKDIKEWNKATIHKSSALEPGMTLNYSFEGEFKVQKLDHSYKIKTGDTLGGIAKNIYGKVTKWKKLQKYNSRLIKDPNRIFAGFSLYYNITPQEQQEAEGLNNHLSAAPSAIEEKKPQHAATPQQHINAHKPIAVPPAPPLPAPAAVESQPPEPVAAAPEGGGISQ